MAKSSGYTISEFVDYLCQETEQIPAGFEPHELQAIRSLAQRHKASAALEEVRTLAKQYQQITLVDLIKSIAQEALATPTLTPINQQVSLDSPDNIRIALYKRNAKAKIISIKHNLITLEAPHLKRVPKLEAGYGYKGGAARLALAVTLGEKVTFYAPRDLDLVRIGKCACSQDIEIAKKYMPDDLKFGHGVELTPNLKTYFKTRDLTINQVIYLDGKIVCSRIGLEDTLNDILRPTAHVLDAKQHMQGKIATKILRLVAEGTVQGRYRTVIGLSKSQKVSPFDIALHLDRALSKGSRIAGLYISECLKKGFLKLEEGQLGIGETIEQLRRTVPGKLHQFENLGTRSKSVSAHFPVKRRTNTKTRKRKAS